MSAHSDRKKRLGSRRTAPKLKEASKPDYHEVENMSADQQVVPEEDAKSLLALTADGSTSEIQHPPAPEVLMHRKKLGSSRKRKGGHHGKGFEPQENIEQETESNSPETKMSAAAQLEMHEELNRGSEHDIAATRDDSMSSASPFDPTEVNPTTTVCLEDVSESLITKADHLQSCQNETKGADFLENEELQESKPTIGLSDPTSLGVSSCPQLDQEIITNQAENFNMCVLAESESPVKDDADLFRQDGSLQSDYWVDESHGKSVVLHFVTTEKTTNKSSPEEKKEIKETNILSPKEKFPTNEEHYKVFKLSEVTDSQHSESDVKTEYEKDGKMLPLQDMHQNDVSSQSATRHDKENPDTCSEDQGPENISNEQSELVVKSTDSAVNREVSTSDEKQNKCPTRDEHPGALDQKNENGDAIDFKKTGITNLDGADGGLVETKIIQSYEQSGHQVEGVVTADYNAPLDPQLQDSSPSMDEQINPGFSLSGNRRKLASSRKIKGRRLVKKSEEDILDNLGDVEALETTNIPLEKTTGQEELSQDSDHDILLPLSHDSSLFPICAAGYSEVQISVPAKHAEEDLEILILKSKRPPEDQDEREAENNLKVANRSVEVSLQEVDKSESCQNKEDVSSHISENAEQELVEDEVHTTQMQKNLLSDYTSELTADKAKENCLVTFGNQIDQDKTINTGLLEFTVKSPDNSAAKQQVSETDDKTDVYPTKENISEALDARNEDYEFYDTNNPHLSDAGKVNSAPSQVHEFMGRVVADDLKPDAEQIFHLEKEGPLSEMVANKSVLLTFHSQSTVSQSFPEGQPEESSVSVDEEYSMDFPRRKKMGSSRKNKGKQKVKDVVAETCYEESDFNANSNESSGTACQENLSEIMLEGEQNMDILQTQGANAHSGSLICTSESTIFGEHSASITDELPSVSLMTDTKNWERDESTELSRQDEDFQPGHLVCKALSPSEMETEKSSRVEHTEPERRGEKASALDELPTKEEHLSNVRVTRQSEDAVRKGHEQKIEPAQAQDMSGTDYTIQKEEDDATEKNENLSRTSNDQFEIGDIHWPEVAVKSVDDSQPQISDIERVDNAPVDAYEVKNQGKDDMSQNAEETSLKVIEGLFSEMGGTKMYLQSLGHEMQASLDSWQSDTSFSPDKNKGALGSSQEKSMEIKLEETDKTNPLHTENVTVYGKQNADLGTVADITEFTISSSHLSPAAELQLSESYSSELPDDRLPTVSSITENKEQDEDMEMLMSYGNSQGNENTENTSTTETTTGESNHENYTEFEYSVEQTFSSPQDTFLKNEEQGENFNSSEAAGTEHSEDTVSEAHKEQTVSTEHQETHQIPQTSITESKCSLQTLQSDTDVPLDSKPQDDFFFKSQSGFKPAGNRRKMGSSRRNKGAHRVKGTEASQKLKEGDLENTEHDEATEKLATKTRQEELTDIISAEKVEKSSSTGTEDENTVKLLEVSMCVPHNVVDNSAVATSDIDPDKEDSPKSITGNNEKDTKPPESLGQFTGFHNDKKDLMQSPEASVYKAETDTQNILYHDDIISPANQVPDQEEVFQCPNTDALSCDKSSRGQGVQLQQTENVIETVGYFTTEEDHSAEVEGTADVGRAEQDLGEEHVLEIQEVNTSHESAVDKSPTMDTRTSGAGKTLTDYSENVQEKPQQRKRKFASTRRILLKRKQEGTTDNIDKTEDENVQPLQGTAEQQDTDKARSSLYEESQLQSHTSNQQSSKDDVIQVSLPEESHYVSEVVVSLVTFDKVADKGSDEKNVDHVEASQLNDFRSTEVQKTSVVAGENSSSLSQLVTSNTEAEAANALESSELEIKNASPDFNLTHRRKKMASTRRSLGSRAKGENLHQKQELDDEATETLTAGEDGTSESFSSFKDKQLQFQTEHKESYSKQDDEEEAVDITNVDESILQPLVEQKPEENPVSQSQQVETQDQLTLNYHPPLSTSPKSDVPSDLASGGRKKKFGSNRKSRLHQSNKEQTQNDRVTDAENENVSGITEEGGHKAAEDNREDPSRLNKISEVDEDDDNASPSISISKAEELSQPEIKTTPIKSQRAEISLVQESKRQISFAGDSRGMELFSDSYNVVMIGDSCVGKTSFMKRAQSGKFSLDLPASVGLDSCKWTVVVDGKPVMIQLWDTAGQERFRSITRQIFHKAHAFLLMYDITSTQSFSAVSYWADCIQEAAAENVTVLLLGNKSDHEGRQVKTQQGEILAKEYKFEFMECSAATGENVIEALETVARMLSQRADLREEATVLHKAPAQKKQSTCC